MRSLLLLAAGASLAACSSNDDRGAATIDSASGFVAPATAGVAGDTGVGSMGAVSPAPGDSTTGTVGGTVGGTAGGTMRPGDSTTPTGAAAAGGAPGNQSQSGVVDSKTGASTLGPGATKMRPDQGQATTSKGDTLTRPQPPR